ncbi:FtsB family cell division protein [Alkaliphilus serpentinus]|uniref:Septum formation initiator n=1 Tax=Alkaliphilus serpentinus TaxID=1482731 RepID=A0A833HQJ6_9FIRM|nr:septum formation initiator family protein [Alkaliphilus serpentinus]KAB3531857.1 hypothetical protein F8153_03830 [Alkaliphilus serpentinus]
MPKKKLKFNRILMLFIPIFLSAYVLFTLYEQQMEMVELKKQEGNYVEKLNATLNEIEEIKAQIEGASEDGFIEKIAREQLKMIGSDEVIFIDMGKGGK